MTNSQKWVGVFLVVFFLLLVIGKLTENDGDNYQESGYAEESEENSSVEATNIKAFMMQTGCTQCHGSDLKGTAMAPGLNAVKERWEKSELVSYIKNPVEFKDDERLIGYKEKFRTVMPPYENIPDEKINQIADYLLTLEK